MAKIKLTDILLIIVLIILIIVFIWRIFGKSPTLDQLSMALSLLFLVLAFESRSNSKDLKKFSLAMLSKLEDIKTELSKINKKL